MIVHDSRDAADPFVCVDQAAFPAFGPVPGEISVISAPRFSGGRSVRPGNRADLFIESYTYSFRIISATPELVNNYGSLPYEITRKLTQMKQSPASESVAFASYESIRLEQQEGSSRGVPLDNAFLIKL